MGTAAPRRRSRRGRRRPCHGPSGPPPGWDRRRRPWRGRPGRRRRTAAGRAGARDACTACIGRCSGEVYARCIGPPGARESGHRSGTGIGPQREGVGMADRCLLVTWGEVVRGREERALEVFNESMGLYGRMQQDGRIEGFDTVLLVPNGSMDGHVELKGSAQQINAVKESEDFQRMTYAASLIVDDLRLIDGYCNEGVAKQMELYQEAIAKVPQTA